MAASTKNVCSPSAWRIGFMYLEYRRSTGNACRLASVWCCGRVDKSVSRYASAGSGHCTRFDLISAHIIGKWLSRYNHCRGAACVSHIRWRCQRRRTSFWWPRPVICQPARWQDASIAIGSGDGSPEIYYKIPTDILFRTISNLSHIIVQILDILRFEPPLEDLGATYTVHLRLIGKLVVHYLFVDYIFPLLLHLSHHFQPLNSLICAVVPLINYSLSHSAKLTHSRTLFRNSPHWFYGFDSDFLSDFVRWSVF